MNDNAMINDVSPITLLNQHVRQKKEFLFGGYSPFSDTPIHELVEVFVEGQMLNPSCSENKNNEVRTNSLQHRWISPRFNRER